MKKKENFFFIKRTIFLLNFIVFLMFTYINKIAKKIYFPLFISDIMKKDNH